ncbi:ATP-binding protein [Kitasatospora sp. RB6PN24]|uniref:ATP-binding protein n=1 Tax=Kitasatospora humi TaxID=2893891 RepID=UPI001E472D8E|nr:ATP-binding protein [Kitasatospora humi]MCC9311935.1 ATP-binding protein [Kitasatospora humi]
MSRQLPLPDEFHVKDEVNAVHHARNRITTVVGSWDVPLSRAALADVKLCASEVITNALLHGGGECSVRVQWTGTHLKIDVTDLSLRPPQPAAQNTEALGGRGLTLVEEFSHSWGWEPHGAGKKVFFLVAADAALIGDRRLTSLVRAANDQLQQVPA